MFALGAAIQMNSTLWAALGQTSTSIILLMVFGACITLISCCGVACARRNSQGGLAIFLLVKIIAFIGLLVGIGFLGSWMTSVGSISITHHKVAGMETLTRAMNCSFNLCCNGGAAPGTSKTLRDRRLQRLAATAPRRQRRLYGSTSPKKKKEGDEGAKKDSSSSSSSSSKTKATTAAPAAAAEEEEEAKVRCVEHHDCPANGPSKACCVSAVCGVADPADPNGANAFDYQQGLTAARREAMCAPLEAQDLLGGGNCNSLAKYEGGLSEWVHHYAVLLVAVTGAMLAFLFADLACTYCFIRDIGRRAQLEKDSAAYEMATQTPVTADSAEREARSFFGSAEKKKRPKKKKKKKKPPADTDPLTEEQSTSSFSQV
eukprot:g5441.t1